MATQEKPKEQPLFIVNKKFSFSRKPIVCTIQRKTSDGWEVVKTIKKPIKTKEFIFNGNTYQIDLTKATRKGGKLLLTYEYRTMLPIAFGENTQPPTDNYTKIMESTFISKIAKMPKMYLLAIGCLAIGVTIAFVIVGLMFTQYQQAQNQIVTLTAQNQVWIDRYNNLYNYTANLYNAFISQNHTITPNPPINYSDGIPIIH